MNNLHHLPREIWRIVATYYAAWYWKERAHIPLLIQTQSIRSTLDSSLLHDWYGVVLDFREHYRLRKWHDVKLWVIRSERETIEEYLSHSKSNQH